MKVSLQQIVAAIICIIVITTNQVQDTEASILVGATTVCMQVKKEIFRPSSNCIAHCESNSKKAKCHGPRCYCNPFPWIETSIIQ